MNLLELVPILAKKMRNMEKLPDEKCKSVDGVKTEIAETLSKNALVRM